MTYGHALAKNPSCPVQVMKFTILVDPSLVIISMYSICLIYAQNYREIFLKKYINFSCLLTLKMLHTKLID